MIIFESKIGGLKKILKSIKGYLIRLSKRTKKNNDVAPITKNGAICSKEE